jgi:signal transduction histidine kinase/GAF domain-containing protein/ActR/RegA family two-component response regulator
MNERVHAAPTEARARIHRLLGLTSRLSEPLPAEEVARVVVDQAQAAVGALTALMWTVDDPPTHATLVRAVGHDAGVLDRYARIPLEPWLPMGDAMLRGEPLFFESRAEFRDRYETAEKQVTGKEPFRELSYACLPLVAHGRAIAGVSLVFPGTRAFDEEERMFLTVLAHHAAQALERASLFEREKQTLHRLASLQQLTSALSSAATVEAVATLASRVGAEALGLTAAGLWATDEQGDLWLLGEYSMPEEGRTLFRRIPVDSTLPAARIARERRPLWCESEQDLELEHPSIKAALGHGAQFKAYGALPLVRNDRVLGVLAFSAGRARRFLPEERAFLSTVAEHCADAFARARLYDDARQAERRLQSVLERLPVGVIISRPPDSTLVFSNDAYARIFRADTMPVDGVERCKMMKASYPDGRPMPRAYSPIVRALQGEVVDALEARIERQDGTNGWIRVSAAPVLRDDGSVEVAVAAAVDVTAEAEARAAADEAGRAKDEFLAMLSHELRNPLTPIITALHLMRMRGAGLERERAVIERQVNHLMRLVEDLLDVSRAVRGALRLERAPVELAAIVAEAIEVAGPLLEERSQKFTVSVPRTGLIIDADLGRLTQVVTNLLGNAAKYTPPAGHITVSARVDGDQVALEVVDDGAGIAPDLLPRVFDPFTQGRQGLDRKQGGLGLGLAIARQLIVAHGGTIEARSAGPGRGTAMVVRLPFAGPCSPQHSTSNDEAKGLPRHGVRRVLIVDDNPDASLLLAEAITEAGHDVRTVGDGPSALQLVETFVPDVAFLDIGLPVMDGYELAGILRQTPTLEHVRLIAISGYAQDDDRKRALASGFVEHLAKPVHLARVLECIEAFSPALARSSSDPRRVDDVVRSM